MIRDADEAMMREATALTLAHEAMSAVSTDDCAEHSCRIKPETLAKVREAIIAIDEAMKEPNDAPQI